MKVAVEIRRAWDGVAQQTDALTPRDGHSVALVWRSEPPPVDAGVPETVASAIAGVLVGLGQVAFRWTDGAAVPPEASFIAAPDRSLAARAKDWLAWTWPADLVVTRSAAVARELFDRDWDMQGQAALVLDAAGGDRAPALSALSVHRDWRGFAMTPPVVALLTPHPDGDGATLTTASREQSDAIIGRLARAFATGGVAMSTPG